MRTLKRKDLFVDGKMMKKILIRAGVLMAIALPLSGCSDGWCWPFDCTASKSSSGVVDDSANTTTTADTSTTTTTRWQWRTQRTRRNTLRNYSEHEERCRNSVSSPAASSVSADARKDGLSDADFTQRVG